MMELRFECPECRGWHDEPADAGVGAWLLCLDCELDVRIREAASDVRSGAVSRAA